MPEVGDGCVVYDMYEVACDWNKNNSQSGQVSRQDMHANEDSLGDGSHGDPVMMDGDLARKLCRPFMIWTFECNLND